LTCTDEGTPEQFGHQGKEARRIKIAITLSWAASPFFVTIIIEVRHHPLRPPFSENADCERANSDLEIAVWLFALYSSLLPWHG
jgi:hypothetical protein